MSQGTGGSGTVDVRALIDAGRFSGLQRLTFALCFCIVLLDGFDTAAIGYIAPSLITEWGVTRPALAPVLSAALFGLAFGALSAGPLADRFGRKAVLVVSVLELGLACLASAFSGDLTQLVALRFLTGLGLGAAMPNAVTLTSEYCPAPRRAFLTNMMFSGFPLGAALGGFLAAWIIPLSGWRSVLVLGGVVPLVLALVLVVALPESLRYLVAKHAPAARIRAIVGRIAPQAAEATAYTLVEETTASGALADRSGLALVLSPAYRIGSMMLWIAYFCGLVIFYALINWMPILFRDAGVAPREAALAAALFPLGGVGAIGLGLLMDRFNPNAMVAAGFLATALAVAAIGQVGGHLGLLMGTVFVAGTLMNTAQSSLPALAAGFYPTQGRATGVAWMLGLGRFGGIAGSFLVAQLAGLSLPTIFSLVALPALIAAAALVVKHLAHPQAVKPVSAMEPVH